MHLIPKLFILGGVFITPFLYSQTPTDHRQNSSRYAAPIDIPMLLSGNYGEIRSAGFHAGIDIKTEQAEGKNVLAANTGYVFRISVQSRGYGKALYLKHPDGQVTVYAHLQQFHPAIETFVRDMQYRKKSFEVDLYPVKNQFVFHQGEFLGFSGNTGSSEGPHLHFEIRDHSSSVPLNALSYGFDIKDETSPKINWLAVYPLDPKSTVNGLHEKLLIQVAGSNGNHYLKANHIEVNGNIGFGIETYDFLDNSVNECSPYTISLSMDGKQIFMCRLDSISFDLSPYVNSYIDYEEKVKSGKKIQKLFIDPNNKLRIYKEAINRGQLRFSDASAHAVSIMVKDTYGNESILSFTVQGTGTVSQIMGEAHDSNVVARFRYDTLNVFENQDIRIVVPRDALFDDINFQYAQVQNDSNQWSMDHLVHHEYTPLLKSYILSIRSSHLTPELQAKAFIASPGKNGRWISQGGDYKNGYVTTKVRSFGKFFVAVDTVSPAINPVTFKKGERYTSNQRLSFIIADVQSGIRKFSGYIDDKWALFEYDAKNDLLTYTIDEGRLEKNRTHTIAIMVADNKDNVTNYKAEFYY